MADFSVQTLILGAGAAGLHCAAHAGRAGKTLVVDHARRAAEKIRISGGGRCNFTNLHTSPNNFISKNPHFAKSALARYTPWDFIGLISAHGLTYHEKTLGQLFCDQKSGAIIQVLLDEAAAAGADLWLETEIGPVRKTDGGYAVDLIRQGQTQQVICQNLVVATGGKSIPKMGATGLGYDLARQFGLPLVDTFAGLVPFTFTGQAKTDMATRSGLSLDAEARCGSAAFREGLLFTHRGLSGPCLLQASSYWAPGQDLHLDFLPGRDVTKMLSETKARHPARSLAAALSTHLPQGVMTFLLADTALAQPLQSFSRQALAAVGDQIHRCTLTPAGTEGYRTAEVTVGGVDTAALSSRTMAAKGHLGLYFIGEVVDVTGWLGGYNFQWAWASAAAAGKAIQAASGLE